MISDFFKIISSGVVKLSHYLYSISKETGKILSDLWKILVLMSDLAIQFIHEKDNNRVQE